MRNKNKKRLLAMLAAASLFVTPSIIQAQNITKTDASKAATITVKGNVTNVTPDRTVNGGKTAINQFAKFELDKGNIANLQFEKAGTLVNFVDSKASINGIVNAVKDNKIGGNLYFLSPNGIAVGADGVINAGKVGLIAPTQDFYDKLLKTDNLSDSHFAQENINQIALNSDGSLVVEGSINAPGGITLAAQDINIERGAKLLNTNTIDFSKLVNVVDSSGVEVSAGLDKNLVLKADDNGGIYITARVDDSTLKNMETDINDLFNNPLTVSIAVGEGAEIISDADVTLSSAVISNRADSDTTSVGSNFWNFKSEVDVAGDIKAKNINLESTIIDNYTHNSTYTAKEGDDEGDGLLSMLGLTQVSGVFKKLSNISHSYIGRDNKATINVAGTANLEAAKNINLNASSEMTTKLTSEAYSKDDAGAGALNVLYLRNASSLNIDGTIKANGNINIESTAGTDISSVAKVDFDKSNNTANSVAFNIAFGQNQSELTVAKSADINSGGKLDMASLAESPVNLETTMQREGSGLGAITASILQFNSVSALKAEGTLAAKGDINISSKYSAPTYKVSTNIFVSNPVSGMEQTEEEAQKTKEAGEAINGIVNDSGSSGETERSEDNVTTNATVVISQHGASIELGKVTTSGNVNIEAANVIDDPQIGAMSVVPVEEDGLGITPVIVYSAIDNNSLVKLGDDITAKSINVKSNLELDNQRIEQVKEDILEIKPRLEKVYDSVIEKAESAGDEEVNAALDEAKTRLDNYLKKIDGTDGTDPMKALTAETNEIVNDLKEYVANDENVQAIIKTLETATDASKIATVYADRESVINAKGKGGSDGFTIAGAALVNIMNNNSVIAFDAGKKLNALSGNFNVDSTLKNVGLSVGGHILPKSLDTAATDIIAGVNIVNDVNAIKFNGNNTLSGDNISITANNNVNHLYLNDGSGKGVNNSLRASGTVSYAGGSSQAGVDVGKAPNINAKNSFKVDAKNNTNIFNMAGGLSYGGGSASVGIGAAVNNFDVNTIANVGNSNDYGSLNSKNIDVKATTDGMVNSLSVAGGLSTSANKNPSDDSNNNLKADSNSITNLTEDAEEQQSSVIPFLDTFSEFVDSETFETISEIYKHFNDAKSVITSTKDKIDKAIDEKTSMLTDAKPDNVNINKTDDLSSQDSQPKVTFDGAGSVSINLGSRNTQSTFAGLDAVNLTAVNVGAFDNNFTGAWSGAGALNFRGADSGKTSVAMTGAVAVNKVDSNVAADISANKNLTGEINNTAEKSGALIAAGLGLTVSKASSDSSNYTGAASASVNLSDNSVKAVLKDNTIVNASSIKNTATNTDTQITGGVNVSVAVGGKKGVAAGGTGVWSDISNDVNAIIDGGTYKTSGAINNSVSTTLTDVAGGVGVSVAQGSESSYGFQGVFTYNKIKNNSHADIKNAEIAASALVNSSSDSKAAAKAYDNTLTGAGLDAGGDSYSEFAKVGDTDSTQKSIESQSTGGEGVAADETVGYTNADYGNKIITAALAVAGAGDGAAQASLAISDVDNDFKSEVTNSKLIIENNTNINAASNTLDINAAAGAAVSSKGFGAGGSISWQTNDNEVVAGFDGGSDKKSLTTNALNVTTENHALEVNVGGQVSGGKGTAAGLAMAYNALNDNTKSYLKNTELNGIAKTFGPPKVDVNINADSSGKVYAVGAGVAVSGNSAALNGSVAVNHGSNSTQAVLENVNSASVRNLNVDSQDSVKKLAVVGGLTVSGGSVAVGGSVAFNDVGTSDNQQLTKVTMKGNEITASGNISVNANDTSDLLTVGVGIGGSSKVAVQGSAAVATLNKDVGISLDSSTINANTVSLKAKTAEDLITTADVLSIGGQVAVGAGRLG